jgi:RNA-directed DNA polymerase
MIKNKDDPHFSLNLRTIPHLCNRLQYSSKSLQYFIKSKENNLKELQLTQIKEGKSKERIVFNPSNEYKKLLRQINITLFRNAHLPVGVLGGIVGKSISDMISLHLGQEYVFSIDLKNFFPNISSHKVDSFLRKSGCSPTISEILTNLMTYKDHLPQGFPTSPMVANLISSVMDIQHLDICRAHRIRRSRWIDDIVFSGRTKDITPNIPSLIGAVKFHGFKISNKKVYTCHRSENPNVLGLQVGKAKPTIPPQVINKISSILDDCRSFGVEFVQDYYETDGFGRKKKLKESLQGKIRHVETYNPADAKKLMELFAEIFNGREKKVGLGYNEL